MGEELHVERARQISKSKDGPGVRWRGDNKEFTIIVTI